MSGLSDAGYDFSALSVKDLIEARDLYHFHLMNKANVVGTAVGLYLIRHEEVWPTRKGESSQPRVKLKTPRTFDNSEVRDYSWPCIVALVRQWIGEDEFGRADGPSLWEAVPKRLYLPDGRAVPVCVVLAPPVPQEAVPTRPVAWPNAIEWGAQQFAGEGERSTYSVATSLSNICKLLDVELVVEGSDALSGTWGATGHYSIGSMAIGLVQDPTLRRFLEANADLLSVPLDDLGQAPKGGQMIDAGFVALADVPDIVWKKYPSPHVNRKGVDIGVTGGRDIRSSGTSSTGPEHATHHCDADRPFAGHATLLEACLADPALLNPASWNEYFDTFPEKVDLWHRGILPFRVWQFFERMTEYAADRPELFLAAAGIMARGVRALAMLWDAAWRAGGGRRNPGRIDPAVLRTHYENPNFIRSAALDEIENEIVDPAPLE